MDTTQSTGNNLTPTLNLQQMQQNIDAMQAQKVPNDQVQSYVDNYQKGADGNYTLKTSQTPVDTVMQKTGQDYSNAIPNLLNAEQSSQIKTNPGSGASDLIPEAGKLLENAGAATLSGIGTVVAPISETIKAVADNFAQNAKDPMNPNQPLTSNPIVGKVLDAFSGVSKTMDDMAKSHPDIANSLNSVVGILLTALGGEEGTADKPVADLPTVNDIKGAADTAVQGAKTIVKAPVDAAVGLKNVASDMATPLDARISTMIDNTTPEEAPQRVADLKNYMDQARTSVKTNEATPYEIAGKTQIQKALQTLKNPDLSNPGLLDTAGQTMQSELGNVSDTHVPTESAEQLLNDKMKNTLGAVHTSAFNLSDFENPGEAVRSLTGNPSGDIFDAPGRTSKITTPSDRALINDTYDAMNRIKAGNDSPQQVADEISNLNRKVADAQGTGVKPIKSPVMSVVSQFTHELENSLNETAGEGYTAAKETYAKLRPLYDELSQKVGKNFKNAASVAKQAFSPVSSTRDLLQRVEESTGVPIFDHLNMAKFAMEVAHDPRVESLLEQGSKVIKGVSGFKLNEPMSWLKSIQSLLEDPEGKATRLLQQKGK